jgi:CheY-like chemotaxis protein/HPt (histidine-containing phosphotransfer) domain-containing protein
VLPFQIGTAAVEDPAVVMNTSHDANVKHHLLVVDDNETNRRVALAVLDHLGFATSFACDGIEAVEAVKHGNFSMVLMDCHMPNMDGFAATTAIREWEKLQGRPFMPIIAVSASAFQDDRNRCSSVGMNDFVAKPVTLNSLQAAVQRWLPATSITETTISAAHPLAISGDDEFPEQLLDRTQFMEMKMITANQFTTLLEKFCADSLLQVQGMRDAALNNNAEAMRKCSHKLKGSSGSIGAKVLSKVCHRMEERARSGNIDGAAEAVDAISVCLDEVIAAIKKLVSGNSSASPQ